MQKTVAISTLQSLVSLHSSSIYQEAIDCIKNELAEALKPSHNSDYTAALRAEIGHFFGMFSNKCLHENNMDKLAERLNSVVKAQQNCA